MSLSSYGKYYFICVALYVFIVWSRSYLHLGLSAYDQSNENAYLYLGIEALTKPVRRISPLEAIFSVILEYKTGDVRNYACEGKQLMFQFDNLS